MFICEASWSISEGGHFARYQHRFTVGARAARVVMITDCVADPRVQYPDAFEAEGIASLLTVPLETRGQAIGVLSVFTNKPYLFSDDEQQLMSVIGEQCSLAIENAKMFAALKHRYETLVDDFHLWFEHSQAHPQRGSVA